MVVCINTAKRSAIIIAFNTAYSSLPFLYF